MSLEKYSKEELKEMSMIEIAYALLSEKTDRQAISFQEIIDEIVKATEMSDTELKSRIAQFYTDINIDGRFLTVGENYWGLRGWYPFDQAEEDIVPAAKPKKKKAKKAVVDELDDFDDLEEEDLDFDDLDELAEEEEEDFDDLEEDVIEEEEEDFDDLDEDLDEEEADEEAEEDLEYEDEK
ncbi:DNA-directed RNA polymerase subunit delta [Priestia flexa]|uniref:DNA-directed RNA polymerase subunit delta n=1 Tax=Priestia flexa TaxID=86664 RepID=UPI001EF4BD1F|nr:DNA-directed RNA polymerase subunit delta [Priestia flexa]MCG7313570.1 DNA-directed RNA polymerase subunit delta [Priestia flexa]